MAINVPRERALRIDAVAQRHGALGPRTPQLAEGCRALAALAGEVLDAAVHEVPLDVDGSPAVAGIGNRAALVRDRTAQLAVMEQPGWPVLTIGGDCGVEHVPLGVARYRHGEGLGAVWFDAHADLNTADTSPSGAFHGMVLRSAFGEGDPEFAASPGLSPGRAVLVGTRCFDPAERAAVEDGLVRHVAVPAAPAEIAAEVRDSGADALYLHLDLDVLDPAEFDGLYYREPGGLSIDQLVTGLRALGEFEVVGAGITECTATDPERLRILVPVLEAVGDLLRRNARG